MENLILVIEKGIRNLGPGVYFLDIKSGRLDLGKKKIVKVW